MRAVVQRVLSAEVRVDGDVVGSIACGLLVFVGVALQDEARDAAALAQKVTHLRIFEDDAGKMNRDVRAVAGRLLAVSQFTLMGDVRRGTRPSFTHAMAPGGAVVLFDAFCDGCRSEGVSVETGIFRAHMDVRSQNDGPVTILLDTKKLF
jgi:D-tyrosyl-tRNA(Tyr) deacylase